MGRRNGVLASVLAVIAVDHARESAKTMMDVVFPRPDGANVTAKRGLVVITHSARDQAAMISLQNNALVVIIVPDARRSAMTTTVVAGNPLRNVLTTVKRSMEFAHILNRLYFCLLLDLCHGKLGYGSWYYLSIL